MRCHSLSLKTVTNKLSLFYSTLQTAASEYDTLKVINYIRTEVAAGRDPKPALAASTPSDASVPWQDDSFLRPVLDNDELLFHDWEAEGIQEGGTEATIAPGDDVASLLEDMRQLAMEDPSIIDFLVSQTAPDGSYPSTSKSNGRETELKSENSSEDEEEDQDAAAAAAAAIDATYFESYSFFDIHREMLSDRVRTEAYRNALEKNPSMTNGATVLDVGCGTGVLSMFAARGGATQVIAVDGSPDIASVARKICAANGFGGEPGDKIAVVSTKIEALTELPGLHSDNSSDGKVDILVSEWMGYALLFESMLDSVLVARDKFLRPGGAILPDIANIYVAAADAGASGLDFWKDVYGLDMSTVGDSLMQAALREAVVRVVSPENLITEEQRLVSLDLATMKPSDQDFSAEFTLRAASGPRTCAALVLWFDTLFSERFCKEAPVELPTGPYGTPTHWAQTVFMLPVPVEMAPAAAGVAGAAVALKGRLSMARRTGRHRTLDISVEYAPVKADGSMGETRVQLYCMGVGGSK